MNRKNILPAVLICCIYILKIQCIELSLDYLPPFCYQSAESCSPQNKCDCVNNGSSLVCCNLQSDKDLLKNFECSGAKLSSAITALHIYNMTADNFNFENLSPFSSLISFSITNSHINRVLGRFMNNEKITCLNVSNNAFDAEWNDPLALDSLKALALLDFSNVNISRLPINNIKVPKFWLDISNSKKVSCDDVLALMKSSRNANRALGFKNTNGSFCATPSSYYWFNSTEKVDLSQLQIIDQLSNDCPKNCKCNAHRLDLIHVRKTETKNTVQVDCSNAALKDLPGNLPENTVLLNVTNNSISSIELLAHDQTYKSLRSFFADNNNISSILSLEGSPFLENYAVLSLKFNQLKKLPTYILQNTFLRDYEGHQVYLGGNKLECDCSTAQSLKRWLLNNRANIVDADDILCENFQSKLKVLELDQKLVCIAEGNWTQYIYYIIAAEFSALVLLIGKVSYDYWVFKTAGYLPWPASKMPKLPCDWIFE